MHSPRYFRRCQCKGPLHDPEGNPILNADGTPKIGSIGLTCPKLGKGHGTWNYSFELDLGEGATRQRDRRGGFARLEDAKKAAQKALKDAQAGVDIRSNETCGELFGRWIKAKKSLARTTRHGYQEHLDNYLVPHLGHIKCRDLAVRHLDRMYDAIEKENAERVLHQLRVDQLKKERDDAHRLWVKAKGKTQERRITRRAFLDANAALREGRKGLRKITSAATMHRINDTLSSALSWAIKTQSLFTKNWAQLVELPSVTRPKPLVWTPERVEHWKRTGEKPGPVMVWTPALTGQFLDFVKDDWLYELWHTFVFLGPRRGEMAALPWTEVSTDALWMRISQQIVEVAYKLYGEAPKADSVRTLSLSLESGDCFCTFRSKQEQKRQEWGDAYIETDRVWTRENGEALHPDWVSRRFARLVELSGLPPVRLHDLRHLAATLSLLAGNDIKVVQEKLGHSSRQITSDTYTSVLPEMMRAEAESVMAVVPRTVVFAVMTPLDLADADWRQNLTSFLAHGARQPDDTWAVGAQTRPDGELLGMVALDGRGQDDAANASVQWIRSHCTEHDLELVRVENLNDRYPEEQRPDYSLTRFTVVRNDTSGPDDWELPTGLPKGAVRAARRSLSKGAKAA